MISYALRAHLSPWLAPVVLAVGFMFARGDYARWQGDVAWSLGLLGTPLIVVLPLLAGCVAFDTARLSVPGSEHMSILTRRRPDYFAAVAALLPTLLSYITLWVGILAISGTGAHDNPITAGAILQPAVQIAAMVFVAGLASLIGKLLSPILASLVAAVAVIGVLFLQAPVEASVSFRLFDILGSLTSMVGIGYTTSYALAQASILLLFGVLLALFPLRVRAGRRRPSVGALLVVSSAVVVMVLAQLIPASRYVEVSAEPSDCRGEGPVVCGFWEQSRSLDQLEPELRSLTDAALEAHYDAFVPLRIHVVPGGDAGVEAFPDSLSLTSAYMDDALWQDEMREPAMVVGELLSPEHCPALSGRVPPSAEFFSAMDDLVGTWLDLAGVSFQWDYTTLDNVDVDRLLQGFETCEGLD